jgi:hypothetical protein
MSVTHDIRPARDNAVRVPWERAPRLVVSAASSERSYDYVKKDLYEAEQSSLNDRPLAATVAVGPCHAGGVCCFARCLCTNRPWTPPNGPPHSPPTTAQDGRGAAFRLALLGEWKDFKFTMGQI